MFICQVSLAEIRESFRRKSRPPLKDQRVFFPTRNSTQRFFSEPAPVVSKPFQESLCNLELLGGQFSATTTTTTTTTTKENHNETTRTTKNQQQPCMCLHHYTWTFFENPRPEVFTFLASWTMARTFKGFWPTHSYFASNEAVNWP